MTKVVHSVVSRFGTVNLEKPLSTEVYELPETPVGKYVVDDSNFVPMSEAVKQLGGNAIGDDVTKSYYDFPTGQDNGMEVPFSRTKECVSIVELGNNILDDTKKTVEKIEKAQKAAKRQADFEKSLADIKSSATSSKTE